MANPTVQLVPYDPKWQTQYHQEKNNIVSALGRSLKGIEHIGSTSVEGMDAKPIIDIMVGVKNLGEVDSLIEPLGNIEYTYIHKPELINRRFFRKGGWRSGTCHLHICQFGGSEWHEKLLFRDYLREFPESAEQYARLKRNLATLYQFDRPRYTKEKEPFIMETLHRAMNK
ncbi:GrpB family protein [Bacillus sp. KH172YL63]|uniref:GrpB family protein n=1 Tax=Bacillus sp. KH172YL63 TaxID=2709784 RepID=UPI0013E4980F|nr:GrpB family protein [Bacillus sp. KH172YL63]BCB03685.1 hypothetical protein KH172YL63_18180 [Bacillus sp. KH172YL63]